MAMMSDFALTLSERIANAYPAAAFLSTDEFDNAPTGTLNALIAAKIVQEADRASTIHCHGCERYCHKPVTVRQQPGSSACRAYIACDEEPHHGRIPVTSRRLLQYRTSLGLIGKFVRQELALPASSQRHVNNQAATIKGRYGTRTVSVELEGQQTVIPVGAESAPIEKLLSIGEHDIEVDFDLLRRLANRKEKRTRTDKDTRHTGVGRQSGSRSCGERDKQILRIAERLRRDENLNWSESADRIAAMDFVRDGSRSQRPIKASTIRRILARMRSGER